MSSEMFRYFYLAVFFLGLFRGQEFWADLNAMTAYETTEFDQLRRLSTPPSSNVNSVYNTVWKFFCRDHFGWREYPEVFTCSFFFLFKLPLIFFFCLSLFFHSSSPTMTRQNYNQRA
jgi:hypothetical protein